MWYLKKMVNCANSGTFQAEISGNLVPVRAEIRAHFLGLVKSCIPVVFYSNRPQGKEIYGTRGYDATEDLHKRGIYMEDQSSPMSSPINISSRLRNVSGLMAYRIGRSGVLGVYYFQDIQGLHQPRIIHSNTSLGTAHKYFDIIKSGPVILRKKEYRVSVRAENVHLYYRLEYPPRAESLL